MGRAVAHKVIDGSRPTGVEFARDVVEEQHGLRVPGLAHALELGELQPEREQALLTLGSVMARRAPFELELELVPVRPERRALAPGIRGPALRERRRELFRSSLPAAT